MANERASATPTIECAENGPYIVRGLRNVIGAGGEIIEGKDVMALCRCGGSKNKPFCDGTHAKIGFGGEKSADRVPDRRDAYVGGGITIHDNRGLCSHAGACTDRLGAVWRLGKEPWIDPDGADVQAIIATIAMCPSGALGYTIDGEEHRDRVPEPAIRVIKGGPYQVTGGVELMTADWGEGAAKEHFALCRCGGSKNKPFCDGTHWNVDFDSAEAGPAASHGERSARGASG